MAPVYHFHPHPKWKQNYHLELHWTLFSWGWCNLKETVSLVNKHYGSSWTRKEFLQRFAIPEEKGLVRREHSSVPDLIMLWETGEYEPTFGHHTSTDFHFLDRWHETEAYIPAGWTKDVLWALYGGCTRAILEDDKKVACLENGTPVFFLTGAGKCH